MSVEWWNRSGEELQTNKSRYRGQTSELTAGSVLDESEMPTMLTKETMQEAETCLVDCARRDVHRVRSMNSHCQIMSPQDQG